MEAIPVLDLRLLTQADINAIAGASCSAAGDSRRCDDVVVPKIDRSVFNESAASRRQTYSRLRLAPRSPKSSLAIKHPPDPPNSRRQENNQIVFFLRQLFAVNAVEHIVKKDISVSDVVEEELMRITEGMKTEEQLLAVLGKLEGKWASTRKRRKIVNACDYSGAFPDGWKLLIGLQRKNQNLRLYCRRFISPCGKQFASYNEASSYLLVRPGLEEARPTAALESTCDKSENLQALDFSCQETREIRCPTSTLSDSFSVGNPSKLEGQQILRCDLCQITFADRDMEIQHARAFHRQGRKRRRYGESMTDGVILKDGAYECQFCHKSFTEKRKYNGHVGVHVRYTDWGLDSSKPTLTFPIASRAEISMSKGDLTAESVPRIDHFSPNGGVHVNSAAGSHSLKEVGASGENDCHFLLTDEKEMNLDSSGDPNSSVQEKCSEENVIPLGKTLQNDLNAGIPGNKFLDVLDKQEPEELPENAEVENGDSSCLVQTDVKMTPESHTMVVSPESMALAESCNDEMVRINNGITHTQSDAKCGVSIQAMQDGIDLSEEFLETMVSGGNHGDMDALTEADISGMMDPPCETANDNFLINEYFCVEEKVTCDRHSNLQMLGDVKSDKEHVCLGNKIEGQDPPHEG